jgi:hypothetical protein
MCVTKNESDTVDRTSEAQGVYSHPHRRRYSEFELAEEAKGSSRKAELTRPDNRKEEKEELNSCRIPPRRCRQTKDPAWHKSHGET